MAFAKALELPGQVQPVFVFDSDILKRFSNKKDRRLTFIAQALWKINSSLAKKNYGVLIILVERRKLFQKTYRIVASFLTKDLHLDWRRGEEHFAQWLMDYELASNVVRWQWASSTGADAAPYFRIFIL